MSNMTSPPQYDEKKDLEYGTTGTNLQPVVSKREGIVEDAVFGEVADGGPDYRAVSPSSCCETSTTLNVFVGGSIADSMVGRLERRSGPHDEDPDRPWRALHSIRLRYLRSYSRSHLPPRYRYYDDVVELYRRCLQVATSRRVRY